jgi:hypothetical protein
MVEGESGTVERLEILEEGGTFSYRSDIHIYI